MLAHADLRHLFRHRHRLSEAARAHEGRHGGGGGHGESAEPDGLDDGAVADVGIGVLGAEARKVESLRRVDGRGEPAIAEPGHANAEVRTVARHGRDDRGARDIQAWIRRGLARGHGQVQKELVVARHELGHAGKRVLVLAGAGEVGHEQAREERRGGDVSLVHLVAHAERLGHEGAEIDASAGLDGRAEEGASLALDPAQPLDDARVIGAEAQDLAEPLVDGGEGAAAGPPLLDEEDGHGGRDHARHGACRPRRVAWRDLHLALDEEVEGLGIVGRPSLVTDGAEDGRLHGLAGRLPAERRSRVEHRAAGEPHHRAGGPAVDQDRLRPGQSSERDLVGGSDRHASSSSSAARSAALRGSPPAGGDHSM